MRRAISLEKVKKLIKGEYDECPCKIKGSCHMTKSQKKHEEFYTYSELSENEEEDEDEEDEILEEENEKDFKVKHHHEKDIEGLVVKYEPNKEDFIEVEIKRPNSMEEAIEQSVRNYKHTIDRLISKKGPNVGNYLVKKLIEKMQTLKNSKLNHETYVTISDALKLMSWFTFFIADQKNSNQLLSLADNYIVGSIPTDVMMKQVDNLVDFDENLNDFVKSGLMIASS